MVRRDGLNSSRGFKMCEVCVVYDMSLGFHPVVAIISLAPAIAVLCGKLVFFRVYVGF